MVFGWFSKACAVRINDQPGRVLAVFVCAPMLACKAYRYNDVEIGVFSFLLFSWDLFWLLYAAPRRPLLA